MASDKKPDAQAPANPATEKKQPAGPDQLVPAEKQSPQSTEGVPAAEKKKKEPPKPEPATKAITRPGKVRLNELVMEKDIYCLRDDEELSETSLEPLIESIILENGITVPVEYAVVDEIKKLLRGYRRVTALKIVVNRGVAGFSFDMEIPAVEVMEATLADMFMRSLFDNYNRKEPKGLARIRGVKKCVELGVPEDRAASGLQVSLQTYRRDRLTATHPWMYTLVVAHKIGQTQASALLHEAVKVNRVPELQEDLLACIAIKEKEIEEEDRVSQEKTGKAMKPSDKEVKKYLPSALVLHWLNQIRNKERLSMNVKSLIVAGFDRKKQQLTLGDKTTYVGDTPLAELTESHGTFGQLYKDFGKYLKMRYVLEQMDPESESEDKGIDVNLLRASGAGSIANELTDEARRRAEQQQAAEQEAETDDQEDQENEGDQA